MPDDEREADDGRVEGWANAVEPGSDEEDEDYMGESDDESELEEGGTDSEDSGSSYLDDDESDVNGAENKGEENEACVIGTGLIGSGVIDAGVIEVNDTLDVNSVGEIASGMVGDEVEESYDAEVVTNKKNNSRMDSQRSFYDLRSNTKRA